MNFTELLHKIEAALSDKLPFVAYRKPQQNTVNGIFQKSSFLHKIDDFSQKGFVFSPFLAKNDTFLIPFENSEICKALFEKTSVSTFGVDFNQNETNKDNHIKLVNKTIDFIKSGKAKKVVISRKEDFQLEKFSISNIFQKLLANYKAAMVYVWFHPKVGLWLGATPETLLSVHGYKFKTMALAGTQLFKDKIDVVWQQKEIEEQQYVTDYILQNLKDIISDLKTSEIKTIKAGNLLHLCTDITGNLKNGNDLQLLIESLHPTPAVCGLPKQISQEFILENENYNREFYTGYLGELNLDNATNIFVNLRCMKIANNKASLYVGGGITKDSDAENEWQETVEKSKVMLNVLT